MGKVMEGGPQSPVGTVAQAVGAANAEAPAAALLVCPRSSNEASVPDWSEAVNSRRRGQRG